MRLIIGKDTALKKSHYFAQSTSSKRKSTYNN
ncbi:hypothetical protein [Lacrimispora sp.]